MGFSMMSRPFSFYYVKVFLNEYHVPESWFHFSQLLYMIWNAVNDPLFALLVIFGTPFVGRVGYFRAIRYNFVWKVFGGLAMYFILGPSNPWLLMLFILLDTTFASATFSLFNMPLADIADNDKEKYNRRHPISSTVFGNNALVTKPAQSIAPMLIVAVLNRYGYEQLKTGALPGFETHVIKNVMFQIICFTPVVLGILQYFVWSQFTIYRRTERTVHDYEI
nr:hypothetical protein BaRGS_027762 [Batillaria attramentaria]